MVRISGEVSEEIKACIADKKNPDRCINKVLENHGIDVEDKSKILEKLVKEDGGRS